VELAPLALRRTPGTAVSHDRGRAFDFGRWWRGEILEQACRLGRAAAPGRKPRDPVDLLEAVQAHTHHVTDIDRLRRLCRGVVHAHMPGLAGRGRLATRLREARRPDPGIHSSRHAPSLLAAATPLRRYATFGTAE